MRAYATLHLALEQMRVRALRAARGSPAPDARGGAGAGAGTDPPRVLVLGPEHAGKTTLCKLLANYAARAGQGWAPFLVNVDPSEVRRVACLWLGYRTDCVGGLGGARCGVRRACARAHPDRVACEPTWDGGDDGARVAQCERAGAAGVLVRPCGDEAQPATHGPPYSESGRECDGSV